MFLETFQHSPHDIPMLRQCLSEYEDVIQVDADNPFRYHVLEDVIHHCLEGGGAVREAEEHDLWFEEPMVCAEGGFPFISVTDFKSFLLWSQDLKFNLCGLQQDICSDGVK